MENHPREGRESQSRGTSPRQAPVSAPRVFNDRGATLVAVNVTPRIAPGVVMLPHGAWYNPGPDGTDRAGTANILTSWHPTSLAKSNPQYSTLVELEKTTAPDLEDE